MVYSLEAYTYEEPLQNAEEAFRAANQIFVRESSASSLTSYQRDVAACLALAEKEESMTGVSGVPRLKVFQQAAIADLLVGIESAFGLNVTELAKCLKASRQVVYDWRKNHSAAGRTEHRRRSERLNELADNWWDKVGEPVSRRLRNWPILEEGNLCDVLAGDDLYDPSVEQALDILAEEALKEKKRRKAGGAAKRARSRELGDLLEIANG